MDPQPGQSNDDDGGGVRVGRASEEQFHSKYPASNSCIEKGKTQGGTRLFQCRTGTFEKGH